MVAGLADAAVVGCKVLMQPPALNSHCTIAETDPVCNMGSDVVAVVVAAAAAVVDVDVVALSRN